MPIAIHGKFEGGDGQIFTPPPTGADHKLIQRWTKAKMWFNMLDAQYHESITHLGFTHLLMDGVSVCVHRNLSERHPVFKLLAPHFRHMHAINNLAANTLIDFGGYVDLDMYYGRKHMLRLIAKHNTKWHLNQQGSLKWDLENRGVEGLPGYYFKDDAWNIHEAIRNYVEEYLKLYYENDNTVKQDEELQALRRELTAPRSLTGGGGCGMQGVPNFDSISSLATSLVSFIYICSVEHSATNFPQYEQYGFPPNYAAKLNGHPEEQHGATQLDAALPTGKEFFSTIRMMKLLTTVLTNNLGNYEKEYMNAMDKDAQRIVQNFQKALGQITIDIKNRNSQIQQHPQNQWKVQTYPYTWLLPDRVLNSISI
ncbi:allene oxide synthase-lipoxygenase protein-like [Ostrea edulis]|uniref:allene oxide synthase-lipoxygenase protein-like n=1 Tax=Ostrea edulis TaxID=37623 RepID=UPI0024AE98EA|nr:allene oxide synthase-lipoxygenase protein-like [Ostrea edulis]